jgi:DNA-binding transcriptional ArsR family regulator/arsenate reductase-like glutaredoxin family protein
MALTLEFKRKLIDSISKAPCSIQELSQKFEKNWRTIDNYIKKLQEEGLVCIKEFKKGERVSFKIAYLRPDISNYDSRVKKKILRNIENGKLSSDFSPLDIIQFLSEKDIESYFKPLNIPFKQPELELFFNQAQTSILIFSGDLDWLEAKVKNKTFFDILKQLAKEKVFIKILARVDMSTKDRIKKLLKINQELGFDAVEIHHQEHPLRCFILDGKIARLKEPVFSHKNDGTLVKLGTYIYNIKDQSWVNWLEQVFWNQFRSSIPAEKRLNVLNRIRVKQ